MVIFAVMVTFAVALTLAGLACYSVAKSLRVSEPEDEDWLL